MKYLLAFVLFAQSAAYASEPGWDSLLVQRRFFELRAALQSPGYQQLPVARQLYYAAFVENFFNNLTASNQNIDRLLQSYSAQLNTKQRINLLTKKIDNHVKLYEYKLAHRTSRQLLKQYGHLLTPGELKEIKNSDLIWAALQQTAPQRTTITADNRVPYKRDIAKLLNIPVAFGDSSWHFVFDTGANLSVITETYALKAGIQLLHTFFDVTAITGMEVKASLGVARTMHLGDITVENVVFIVFPDSVLSFAGGAYKINGIIGFPVIEQLQEVHINKSGFITVPAISQAKDIRNFGIDELTPVIRLVLNNDTLAFTFDTGAQATHLNALYYQRYKAQIDSVGKPYMMNYGGAGGSRQLQAYNLEKTSFTVSGSTVEVNKVDVKTVGAGTRSEYYYGNLGQDLMQQFSEMIINFRYMYVDFVK